MKNFDMKKINQAGSLMIEAIAMLGLISLVTPVVYKKSAERMTELQDINAASHLRMLSSALDAYISDNYDKLKDSVGEYTLTADKLANYLPNGAVEEGKVYGPLGEDYKFSYVVKETDNDKKPVITGYVGANVTDDKITAQRTSRIATMIGGNGAVVDNGDVLGVQGTWQTKASKIKFDGINDNSVVVASQNAVGATAQIDTSKFLYRVEDDVENNTMQTNLYMHDGHNSHSIEGVSQLLIGYQMGRGGNQNGDQDDMDYTVSGNSSKPNDYALYVNSKGNNDGDVWIGGNLLAMKGRLIVQEKNFNYNPYDTDKERGFVVDDTGMYFTVAGDDTDKLYVKDKQMTYAGNLVVAENGAGNTTEQAVRFFGSSTTSGKNTIDTSAATFTEGEARFFGEADGPKVSIKKDGTTIRNQLVAMNPKNIAVAGEKTTYTTAAGFKDYYTRIGESAPAESNYKVSYSDAENANILSGRTIATQLETGYLKSDNFDTKSLRAGRSNLNDSEDSKDNKETWNLDVDEKGVKIGYKRGENEALPAQYAYINVASSGDLEAARHNIGGADKLEQGTIQMKTVRDLSLSQLDIGRIYNDDGTPKSDGGIAMTVTGKTVAAGKENNDKASLVMRSERSKSTYDYDIEMKALGAGKSVEKVSIEDSAGRILIQAGEKSRTEDEKNFTNKVYYNGAVEIKSVNLLVKNEVSGQDHTGYNDKDADAWVYIRKGAIDLKTDKNQKNEVADAGTGYVKADRFVVENTEEKTSESVVLDRNPEHVYNTDTYKGETPYDHYMVDPAYTSVMHDIKLTSRGGARLSDILPDFINKGIYVTDNSYGEGTGPDKTVDTTFASAFLGVVPAPQCPPGYAKVITLTPAGWRMAQIGTLVEDSKSDNRLYLNETTPEYKDKKIIKETEYAVTTNSGSNSVVRIPKIFQQNTWLKSAIKLNTEGEEDKQKGNQYSESGKFVGWNTYMGFIYPAVLWNHLFKDKGIEGVGGTDAPQLGQGNNTIYWNLFPVDKWSIEGYATVYCYFDRNGLTNLDKAGKRIGDYFNPSLVDTEYNQYSKFREVSQGASKWNSKYTGRLTNPKLKYKQEW